MRNTFIQCDRWWALLSFPERVIRVEPSIFMVRLALGMIRMSVEKWVLYIPVKLNLKTSDRFSVGTEN
ncbi:hypothetical protein IQ224_10970 [Microcystis sp. LEGE 00066]|uniref:Similarity n=2 Tax=Microcystis aeruginosa (strain PCC 7806) TaxID=267872 RepID=A8YCP9_MICA7|nr:MULTISPECIES: hypothetical protein [Microcystis]ARI83679.1 hypothetical protein BH695_4400 [Microcystis aeruginosa PCC 7806SL]MBE9262689.1 hypothetical protein [Microcystis sp. LEGE 00066]UGS09698.1 hypothetical protein LRR78_03020 [Microcystis aeruginosa FACHB-905 = DIANCHI905]WKX60744.1 hypothetical protein Q3H53_000605 [Microcystis aeruginosa PCC 7806]CAO89226.1 unnamed protein product [Microcystis aeruginosa PCC 7806]